MMTAGWLTFAGYLAVRRRSKEMSPRDLLGGLYICWFERISPYWPETEDLDNLVQTECLVSPPVWFARMEAYDAVYRRKFSFMGRCSRDVDTILTTARDAAKTNAPRSPQGWTEHLLLAMAKHSELDISGKLLESGIDLDVLRARIEQP